MPFLKTRRKVPACSVDKDICVTISLDHGVFELLPVGMARARLAYFTAETDDGATCQEGSVWSDILEGGKDGGKPARLRAT